MKPYTSFGEDDELHVKLRRALGCDLGKYSQLPPLHWYDAVILHPCAGSKVFGLSAKCATHTDRISGVFDDAGYMPLNQSELCRTGIAPSTLHSLACRCH